MYFLLNGWNPDNALPWSIFRYLSYLHSPYGMYLAISFIAPNILMAAMIGMLVFKPEDTNSRWAKTHDLRKANLLQKCGLILGKHQGNFIKNDDPTHAFVIAPTRSGKGVGLVIPNLLAWSGSFICLDVKGENHRITSGWRAHHNHTIINFCPFSKDKKSHCYNPLDYISTDPNTRITDLQVMASSLIATSERADPHFPEEAQDLFVGLALYVMDHKDFPSTIGSIFRLLGTEDELAEILQHVAQTHPEL
ncbi:MAG: type IV secretory system conjugative DNA transfer family protein, partial [Candidatus Hydrogenedentes bacterium]|nr:type IV secretory system conjugative DNA transfer family protein [Candidatus Hydrogenedentota bacterium]